MGTLLEDTNDPLEDSSGVIYGWAGNEFIVFIGEKERGVGTSVAGIRLFGFGYN